MRKDATEKLSEFVFFEAKDNADSYKSSIFPIGTLIQKYFGGKKLPIKLLNEHNKEMQDKLFELANELNN